MEARIEEQTRSFKYTLHLTTSQYRRLHPYALNHSTSTTTTSPPQTFHLFPALPPELREQIWLLTHPLPRLIEVYTETSRCQTGHCHGGCRHARVGQFFASNPHDPSFLHVCREARAIALKHFSYCFRTSPSLRTMAAPPLIQRSWRPGNDDEIRVFETKCKVASLGVLFSPTRDTIWLRGETRLTMKEVLDDAAMDEIDVSAVQSLAVDDWENGPGPGTIDGLPMQDWIFPQLFRGAGTTTALSGLRELIVMRVWQSARPSSESLGMEKLASERWRAWVREFLVRFEHPRAEDVRIEILRKSLLWDREERVREGEERLRWERDARPHWIAYPISKEARLRALRKHDHFLAF